MQVALFVVVLVAVVLTGIVLAARLRVPAPLLLLLVGTAASYVPGLPEVHLTPELALVGLLPPLLYGAAIRTSFVDVRRHRFAIGYLAVGLVIVTTLAVGWVVSALLGVPFAVGCALGAVVAPPDAVAATAVARTIGLPRRLIRVLEGESLVNDAAALVALRTATTAMVTSVSLLSVIGSFAYAVALGLVIGLGVGLLVARLRERLTDPRVDTGLSFLVPFIAFLPAEQVHASGVLAVVTAGLVLGHKAATLQSASARVTERLTWSSVTTVLEHLVFLLIGLQASSINEAVLDSGYGLRSVVVVTAAVLALVVLIRPVMLLLVRVPLLRRPDVPRSGSWQESAVLSWAGMRGVVTLAAALGLPADTPARPVLVLIALVVTLGTLLLQGFSLGAVARSLDVRGPDPREDLLQVASVLSRASRVGMAEVRRIATDADQEAVSLIAARNESRLNSAWEQLGAPDAVVETPGETYRRLRLHMLGVMRGEITRIRDAGEADSEVVAEIMEALDVEEAALERIKDRGDTVSQASLGVAEAEPGCAHLAEAPLVVAPRTPDACGACQAEGTTWVHLRMCLTCGEVGCCDSSPRRHAAAHFRATGHPVMRSVEPGEHWRWCYLDETLG